ncbi:MAG: riboflavin synthase [Planctomycetota bacterium]|nr:riboflavin synthase [Planctomycetota bacterium]
MFTGIVEGQGTVKHIDRGEGEIQLVLSPPSDLLNDCAIGDSIAVNGCCLTVIAITENGWTFQAGDETLAKTNLGELQVGGPANFERSMRADGRLGGHIVQGHVDGTGIVDDIQEHGDWTDMWFQVPNSVARQMVPKGSVTVDGVSLTLVNVEAERFSVALIPHTLEVTTLGRRVIGERVNVETDILGKYILKYLDNLDLQVRS